MEDFNCDFLTLHPYYIYLHYPQKQKKQFQREKLQIGFPTTQHNTPIFQREGYTSLGEIIVASSPSLSHCHTLRGDLYLNIIHTFSECRECFGAWKVLGICQKKLVRLGRYNQAYCRIWKTSKDKTPRSSLVAGVWRAQVHWIEQVWSVFCYLCIPTYSLVDRFRLGRSQRSFSLSSLVSSSITRLDVILYLHLFSLTLVLYFYCLLFMFMYQSSYWFIAHIYSCSRL